tara:strand:- start:410 stop:763 length:354 start_codon:yes stop_codon:yes gene_type:complete
MVDDSVFEAFNNRLVNTVELKKLTPLQADRVKQLGSAAENLIKNRDFVLFVRQFQLENMDALVEITGHTEDAINQRVALSNHFVAMDNFISLLKRQVVLKNRVVTLQEQQVQTEPNT